MNYFNDASECQGTCYLNPYKALEDFSEETFNTTLSCVFLKQSKQTTSTSHGAMIQWGNLEHQVEPCFRVTMCPDTEALSLPEASCCGTHTVLLPWFSSQVDSRDSTKFSFKSQAVGLYPLVSPEY
jgi:hypothetical protein